MNKKERQLLMYFHTTIRNIGLYTSISIAMLGYSRFYRGKNKMYNISFIFISLLFLSFSLILNYYLTKSIDSTDIKRTETSIDLTYLKIIPKLILFTNVIVFLFGLYTLISEIKIKLLT